MPLTESQKKHLRGLAQARQPVVMVGQQGLKDSVLEELEAALTRHELVKVRVSAGDRRLRDEMIEALRARSGAELVQRVGNIAVFFRRNTERPVVELPRG